MQTIVVGVGYTGQRVLAALPADEAQGISRSKIDLDQDEPSRPDLPARYSLLYTVPPSRDSEGDVRLERLLDILDPSPARFVYLSTSGVYGDRGGAVVDESTAPDPVSERAERRLAAENLLTEWCAGNGAELVVLRVPGIYGPDRLGLDRIRSGTPVIVESEANPGNRVHVDDLVVCCLRALNPDVQAGVYNVGDGDHRSGTWFAKAVARLAGLDAPREVSRAEATGTFSASRLSFLNESRVVDTTRMREVLGVSPRYADCEDGIRASL